MSKGDVPGEFEQIVLLAVARLHGEGYGVSIRREIEQQAGREVTVGSVYATLDRLEAKGLISSHTGAPTPRRGGRSKRFFSLEPAGAEALQATRAMMDRMWDGVALDGLDSP